MRPTALVVSALLSAWVLTSARRWRFRPVVATGWALGIFLFPFIALPLYLIARGSAKRRVGRKETDRKSHLEAPTELPALAAGPGLVLPAVYLLVLLALIGVYLYRDYNRVDAHLARASQAKVVGQPIKSIREYRAALALEDNPHTHKLLGIELADSNQPAEALREFRFAESGGEPDDSIPFRIAILLDTLNYPKEAASEYERFLEGKLCTQPLPDNRCKAVRVKLKGGSNLP